MKTILVLYILSFGAIVSPTSETVYPNLTQCRNALREMRIDAGEIGGDSWAVVAYCRPELTDD